MINLAGCTMDTPSRSTVFCPPAAESRTTSTNPSSSRLTSSTYSIPRLALARSPGSYALIPSLSAFSMSMVPQILSSVAPSGSSTSGVFAFIDGSFSPLAYLCSTSGPISLLSVGLELKSSPGTTSISGRRSTMERTATDFPQPRSPMISTPPMPGSTTLRRSASFISDWPAMRVNGKFGRRLAGAILTSSVAALVTVSGFWPI
mmetsp:Transcript_8563/g.23186  ORF Transcript_8563/g.23186 Transcript_8563/m.23186 type:complete len:204 (-) Transcript_8563:284-895(-)